ncbi:MAG TPA: sigma-70 family RNA polymerase sigma factor [Rhizomicrobium sp.]|nr:sigma-70 family RNA polymerase sigma factor [Rhizomicrobium sp.]
MADAKTSSGAKDGARETEWAGLMRAGLAGDDAAYRKLLERLAPVLRVIARRGLSRAGSADIEDVVQETLLAIHLKRHTWMTDQPFKPWLNAIARHKLIDVLRRKGRRGEVPIDGLEDALPGESGAVETSQGELARLVARLEGRQLEVVRGISLGGDSIAETAARLGMSEGAVRVTLHRGLKKLSELFRGAP